jgi:hypothetical protein
MGAEIQREAFKNPQQLKLTFSVGSAAHVNHMNQGISLSQVVKELVSQSFAQMGSWNQASDID